MKSPVGDSAEGRPAPPGNAHRISSSRRHPLTVLIAATVLCYAVGYPLALIGHSDIGWIFVFLGGPLLIAVLAVVIRRVHHSP
jgi:hypothetical protein